MAGGEPRRKRLNCTDALPVRYCAVRALHSHREERNPQATRLQHKTSGELSPERPATHSKLEMFFLLRAGGSSPRQTR